MSVMILTNNFSGCSNDINTLDFKVTLSEGQDLSPH